MQRRRRRPRDRLGSVRFNCGRKLIVPDGRWDAALGPFCQMLVTGQRVRRAARLVVVVVVVTNQFGAPASGPLATALF
jgi:hypothetical protein